MAFVLKDRVQVTTTTTGTGTLTLGAADAGFQDFAGVGDGNQTYYTITNGTDWEVGIGTYTSSGTTLSRDQVIASSNSNAAADSGGTGATSSTADAGTSSGAARSEASLLYGAADEVAVRAEIKRVLNS